MEEEAGRGEGTAGGGTRPPLTYLLNLLIYYLLSIICYLAWVGACHGGAVVVLSEYDG
jgi:hypothetical protein